MKRKSTLKRLTALSLSLCLSIGSISVCAKPGDVFTFSKFTNIIAYINHYAIQSYNVNDTTCVCAEDLANFGFAVEWNPDTRSLYITRNTWTNDIEQYSVPYETDPKVLGMDDAPVYETDIKTYVNGAEVISYNIGGKTVVDFESLSAFGKVEWHPEIRALKLWVEDGLEMNRYMQQLKQLPRRTLYSADGRSITVLENEVNDYLNVGWYTSSEAAKKVKEREQNLQAVKKFYVGQTVMQNFIFMTKYGVVESIDTMDGRVKVYWNEIRDSYGNKKNGSTELMFYGLYSSTWEDASDLTPLR